MDKMDRIIELLEAINKKLDRTSVDAVGTPVWETVEARPIHKVSEYVYPQQPYTISPYDPPLDSAAHEANMDRRLNPQPNIEGGPFSN